MILVTGASGQLGRLIIHQLVSRLGSGGVVASCRDPQKASDLVALGIEVRQADFDDPASLARAFSRVSQVLLVSSSARRFGGDPVTQHQNAIDAAKDARVERLVYTSHMAASAASAFSPMHDHAATEARLGSSELSWVALRNGFYAASGLLLLGNAKETGVVNAPVDGPVSWTCHQDLAEAAAIVLCEHLELRGPTPPLTAGDALDLSALCNVASKHYGRKIERKVVSDPAYTRILRDRGLPAGAVAIGFELYEAARRDEFSAVHPQLSEWLGRAPLTVSELMARE